MSSSTKTARTKRIVAILVIMLLSSVCLQNKASAITLQEAKTALAYYLQLQQTYCKSGNPNYSGVCSQISQVIAYYQSVIRQLSSTGSGGGGADPCDARRAEISRNAEAGRVAALNYIASHTPPRNGWVLYYQKPTANCTGPVYMPGTYPFTVLKSNASFEINRLASNGNRLTSIGRW